MARFQNCAAVRCSVMLATRYPPSSPERSPTATSNGSTTTVATTRGVISLRMGSIPNPRMASTCSVTTIEPSSEAMAVAFRPEISRAVNTGPNSRSSASETASPVRAVSPKRVNCAAEFKTTAPPTQSSATTTIRSEPTPITSICWITFEK